MMNEQLIYKMDLLKLTISSGTSYDIVFLAGGSDYRAYEALRILDKNTIEVKNILFFEFIERESEDDQYEIPSDSIYKVKAKIFNIRCSIKDPNSSLQLLIESGVDISINSKIGIDISCFTKPYFFYLMKLLNSRFSIQYVEVFYTEPFSYYFPEKTFSSYKSSKGPLTILEIPGYSGREKRNDRRLLVILLGFDGDLSKEICDDITPSKIILVNCFPGYIPKYKDISLIANEKLSSNQDNKIMYSRADNPFEIYNLLTKITSKYEGYFINIAPLGTKPMALGACMYALTNINVRVVYPFPEKYLKITTDKCWNTWHYKLIFE